MILFLDLAIPFTWNILLVLPISFLCLLIAKRFTCLSYGIPALYLLYELFLWAEVGNWNDYFALPYSNLIVLVGIMHMIEGIMTILSRNQYKEVIFSYKRNTVVGGYHVFEKWFIPLLFFYIKGIYIPILAVLIYADDTYGEKPSQKTGVMGGCILGYGVMVALIGYMTFREVFPLALAMICMPILHEGIFEVNRRVEDWT